MTIRCYSYSDNYAFQVLLNAKSELKKCNIDNGTIPRFGWCLLECRVTRSTKEVKTLLSAGL